MEDELIWKNYPIALNLDQLAELLKMNYYDARKLLLTNQIKHEKLGVWYFFIRQEYVMEYLLKDNELKQIIQKEEK